MDHPNKFLRQITDPNTSTMTMDKDGTKVWRLPNGQLHREDGPAVEYTDGQKAWFLNGQPITEAKLKVWQDEQAKIKARQTKS